MKSPILRPFEPRDTEAVVEIADLAWRRIYASHRELFGDELYAILFPDDLHRKGKEMRSHCECTPEHIRVCQVGQLVAGFIMWSLDAEKKIGVIGNNGLHPDFTGQGLGSFMYRSMLDHFRTCGMHHAKVHTGLDKGHSPARRAYEQVGFSIRHETVTYYMSL